MKDLVKVSIRIMSIYYLTKAVSYIGNILSIFIPETGIVFGVESGIKLMPMYLLNLAVSIGIAAILWIFADRIVSHITGNIGTSTISIKLDYHQLMSIVLLVVGILIILGAIPVLFTQLLGIVEFPLNALTLYQRGLMFIRFADPFIRIVIGFLLINNSKKHRV